MRSGSVPMATPFTLGKLSPEVKAWSLASRHHSGPMSPVAAFSVSGMRSCSVPMATPFTLGKLSREAKAWSSTSRHHSGSISPESESVEKPQVWRSKSVERKKLRQANAQV